jgi:hypothetical protein
MSHYTDAEYLLTQADAQAIQARTAAAAELNDWTAGLPGLIGANASLVAALTHAVLAVADAYAATVRGDTDE